MDEDMIVEDRETTEQEDKAFEMMNDNLAERMDDKDIIDFDNTNFDEDGYAFFDDEPEQVFYNGEVWNIIGFTKSRLYILKHSVNDWLIFPNMYDVDNNGVEPTEENIAAANVSYAPNQDGYFIKEL